MKLSPTKALSLLAVSLVCAVPALAAAKKEAAAAKPKVMACDKAWANGAACSDLEELALAKAAETKSQNADVKAHAQQMITDHSKTTAELKAWAKESGVMLKGDLPPEKKAVVAEISAKSGDEFDKAYIKQEVAGHRMAVAHFQNGSEFAMDPKLKAFAETNFPTIKSHLEMVEKMPK